MIRLGDLKRCLALDLFDLTYEYSSEKLKILDLSSHDLPESGFLRRSFAYFMHMFQHLLREWSVGGQPWPTSTLIIFWSVSKNESESLAPLASRTAHSLLLNLANGSAGGLSFALAHILSLPFLPWVAWHYRRATPYQRRAMRATWDHFLLVPGLYLVAVSWFRRHRPALFVVANHIYPYHRILLDAARTTNIKTAYIQHAGIPRHFPALSTDFALLDGIISYQNLVGQHQSPTRSFLIGSSKFDSFYSSICPPRPITKLGFCVNGMDPIARVEELLVQILDYFPNLKILIRVHNADPRIQIFRKLAHRHRVGFSDSTQSISYSFIRQVDCILAGNSGILIESALLNVLPIHYDFPNKSLDYYGWVESGLAVGFNEPGPLLEYLASILGSSQEIRYKAKPFSAAIGTEFDGRSAELGAQILTSLASSTIPQNLPCWVQVQPSKAMPAS
jgi:hypothetical protein